MRWPRALFVASILIVGAVQGPAAQEPGVGGVETELRLFEQFDKDTPRVNRFDRDGDNQVSATERRTAFEYAEAAGAETLKWFADQRRRRIVASGGQ